MDAKLVMLLVIFGAVVFLASSFYYVFENAMAKIRRKKLEKIAPNLDKMFIDIPMHKLIALDVALPVVAGAAGYILSRNIIVTVVLIGVGMIAPVFIIKKLEAMRREKFSSQLVDALLILTSSLKAGLSLIQSFQVLIDEMPAPVNQEFGLVVRQIQMGIPLEEAMMSMRKRMRVDELDMIVTAMMVARESGGDITETFSRLIYTIQERNKLHSRVKVLCVQAQLQGILMSLLPIGFGLFVKQVSPNFFEAFTKDALGIGVLVYACISELFGIFFIIKFSKVDI